MSHNKGKPQTGADAGLELSVQIPQDVRDQHFLNNPGKSKGNALYDSNHAQNVDDKFNNLFISQQPEEFQIAPSQYNKSNHGSHGKTNLNAGYDSRNKNRGKQYESNNNYNSKSRYHSNKDPNQNYASNKEARDHYLANYRAEYEARHDPARLEGELFDVNRYASHQQNNPNYVTEQRTHQKAEVGKKTANALQSNNITGETKWRDPCMDHACYVIMIIIAVLLLAWFIVDLSLSGDLHKDSTKWTKNWQPATNSKDFLYYWFRIWLEIYAYLWWWWPFICMHYYNDKLQGMKSICILLMNYYCVEMLKMLFKRGRPNFYDIGIYDYWCQCTYGQPDEFSAGSMCLYLMIVWDLYCRDTNKSRAMKIFWMVFAVLMSVNVGFGRVYFGTNYYNQVIWGWLLGALVFCLGAMIWFETRYHVFWMKLVNMRNKAKVPRIISAIIISFSKFIILFAVFLIMHYNYTALTLTGSCATSCAGVNFIDREFFNSLVIVYISFFYMCAVCSDLRYDYDSEYSKAQCSSKGVIRFFIFLLCWSPIQLILLMEWVAEDRDFYIYIICTCSYVLMCFISASVLFWCLPGCLKKCNLDLKGDLLRAYVKPAPKPKIDVNPNIENLDEHDANSWECDNEIDKDNLASSKIEQYNMGKSKNYHPNEMGAQKKHNPDRTAEKFEPDMVAEGDVVVEIELEESINENDGKEAGEYFASEGRDKYGVMGVNSKMDESHDCLKPEGGLEVEVEFQGGKQSVHDQHEWRA